MNGNVDITDISATVGPLYPVNHDAEWPMYSYDRPATAFWQGIVDGLANEGFTDTQIKEVLQSKLMRWLFDGDGYDKVYELGKAIATSEAQGWKDAWRKF